jgi:DNA-binding response OmpR family regulator
MTQKHVLIIDDEETTCRAVSRVLQIENFRVTMVNDGEKGLEIILNKKTNKGKNKIDILITDIQMPKMNGVELISRLEENGIDIPIIVISAHFEQNIFESINYSNKIYFLEKPFGSLEIIKRLKEMICT